MNLSFERVWERERRTKRLCSHTSKWCSVSSRWQSKWKSNERFVYTWPVHCSFLIARIDEVFFIMRWHGKCYRFCFYAALVKHETMEMSLLVLSMSAMVEESHIINSMKIITMRMGLLVIFYRYFRHFGRGFDALFAPLFSMYYIVCTMNASA